MLGGLPQAQQAEQQGIYPASCGTCVFSLLFDHLKPAIGCRTKLGPAPSTLTKRFRFNNRSHREGNAHGQFVAALQGLASTCDSRAQIDLCSGTVSSAASTTPPYRRNLKHPNPLLDDAMKAGQAIEAAAKDASEIARAASSPSTEEATKSRTCSHCGDAHFSSQFQYSQAHCFACGKLGALRTYAEAGR
ncbi:hypothetical protein HPB50_012690 [Hyalomma asiaticum]|uniref:Uncharacterized protein n=1 Tax=Hyalomma asiaticum TaxID=266040 RepID=A0ACB7SEY6_HYAAI|nr:hypothetical protein HPB50_012690 [Hyalomma asiaticum]